MVAQMIKDPFAMRETCVRSLGWEDPLEKEMATHSSTLAWRIPWTEEPGGVQSMVSQRVKHDWATNAFIHVCVCVCVHHLYVESKKEDTKKLTYNTEVVSQI